MARPAARTSTQILRDDPNAATKRTQYVFQIGSQIDEGINMTVFSKGDKVAWDWGNGTATGTVHKTYSRKTTRTLKGSKVTRNGTKDDPALYIEQEDGDGVLKLSSEVRKG